MTAPISNTLTLGDQPGPDETTHACEPCALLDRELLLTTGPSMVVVRVFGADAMRNAVRIGTTPERALRLGLAFLRAAYRINPDLKATPEAEAAARLAEVIIAPVVRVERHDDV